MTFYEMRLTTSHNYITFTHMQNALTIHEIKQFLKEHKLKYAWLAQQCFVSVGAVKNWFSSERIPDAKIALIQKIIDEFKIGKPLQELPDMDARGKMEVRLDYDAQRKVEKEALRLGMELSAYCTEAVEWCCSQPDIGERLAARLAAKRKTAPEPDTLAKPVLKQACAPSFDTSPYTIELVGNISAGNLMEGDTIPETLRISRQYPKGSYALRVCGRSMEPAVADGALIVVRPHTVPPVPKAGTLVVYSDGRGVTLKRLAEHGGSYTLESINPAYPDIEPMDGGRITAVYVETIR